MGKIVSSSSDGTLIVTKSGGVFAKNNEDWQLQWPEVSVKLQEYYQKGYKIVIFTNQASERAGG